MATVLTGPMAWLERQLEALSPRDRRLLVGMYAFFGIGGVGALWWTLHGILDDEASRVMAAKQSVQDAQLLEERFRAAMEEVGRQEVRLRQYQGQPASAYIEEIATKRGIIEELRSVNELSAEVVGGFRQAHHKVEFKRLPYEAAFGFLYELEASGFPAHVEMAQFKTTKTREGKLLDMDLELIVYSLAEG